MVLSIKCRQHPPRPSPNYTKRTANDRFSLLYNDHTLIHKDMQTFPFPFTTRNVNELPKSANLTNGVGISKDITNSVIRVF